MLVILMAQNVPESERFHVVNRVEYLDAIHRVVVVFVVK